MAGVLLAVSTLSCQFPAYRVGENGGAGHTDGLGGAGASGAAGDSVGGAAGATGDMVAGGSAGQSGDFPKPIGMALGKTAAPAVWRTSGVGHEFTDACPANHVLIGLQGTTESPPGTVHSVQGICGQVSISKGVDGMGYEAHITRSVLLPERGDRASDQQLADCPSDQLVTGFSGRAGELFDALQIRCAALTIVGAAPNLELIVRGESAAGKLGGLGGSAFEVTECTADQVALGQYVEVNGSPKAFGILCATPSLLLE